MTEDLEFVDELPTSRRGPKGPNTTTIARAEAMKANPGRWMKYPNKTTPKNLVKALASLGEFEAAQRGAILFCRYVGEVSPLTHTPDVPLPVAPHIMMTEEEVTKKAGRALQVQCDFCGDKLSIPSGVTASGARQKHYIESSACRMRSRGLRPVEESG